MEAQLRHTVEAIAQKRKSMEGVRAEIEFQVQGVGSPCLLPCCAMHWWLQRCTAVVRGKRWPPPLPLRRPQEAAGKSPQRGFFGRVLAAMGGGPADPRQVLSNLDTEVTALDRLRQALHAGARCWSLP